MQVSDNQTVFGELLDLITLAMSEEEAFEHGHGSYALNCNIDVTKLESNVLHFFATTAEYEEMLTHANQRLE
jgi:hypothetical protein